MYAYTATHVCVCTLICVFLTLLHGKQFYIACCGRAAMARAEPAVVDVHGAVWTGRHGYELVPSAKRYELYEMSYAAKVPCSPLLYISCTFPNRSHRRIQTAVIMLTVLCVGPALHHGCQTACVECFMACKPAVHVQVCWLLEMYCIAE